MQLSLSTFSLALLPSLVHSSAIISHTTPHAPSIPHPTLLPTTPLHPRPTQTPAPPPAAHLDLKLRSILTDAPTTTSITPTPPSQAPTVTTVWMPSDISGSVKWVEVTFTLTFPTLPGKMPVPSSGRIGFGVGTLTGVERAVQTGGGVGALRGKGIGWLVAAVGAAAVIVGLM